MKSRVIRTFIISDTHFHHAKLVEYQSRPENFDELIWNGLEKLPKDCTLIHLGDICIGHDEEVHERLKKLPYRKVLVLGNHDKKTNKWYLEHGWDFVCETFSGHYFGKYITFSHKPIEGIQNINIHGHLHNDNHRVQESAAFYKPKLHKLLAIEHTLYQPVDLEAFIGQLERQGT